MREQSPGLGAPAHIFTQLSPHRSSQAEAHAESALAKQPMAQSLAQPLRHVPVADVLHWL
jgi:hypothetical protein